LRRDSPCTRNCLRCGCWRKFVPAGFEGSYMQLMLFVRQVWPTALAEPGEPLRNAGGSPSTSRRRAIRVSVGVRYALLVVLGYSRLLWCRFSLRQDMRTLFDGLEGRLPLFRRRSAGAALRADEVISATSGCRWRARPQSRVSPLRPPLELHAARVSAYRAQTKSKVERPVRYLRDNFVYGRTFANDAAPRSAATPLAR
jgi:transposase